MIITLLIELLLIIITLFIFLKIINFIGLTIINNKKKYRRYKKYSYLHNMYNKIMNKIQYVNPDKHYD